MVSAEMDKVAFINTAGKNISMPKDQKTVEVDPISSNLIIKGTHRQLEFLRRKPKLLPLREDILRMTGLPR
jgi:hypothetical protein